MSPTASSPSPKTGRSSLEKSRPDLNCPHCGEPVPLSIWGFNPLTKFVVCRSCYKLSRFPGPARFWGFATLLTVMVVEVLLLKDYGPFEPDTMAGVFGKGLLFLFGAFSSMLAGSFVCRKLSAALVP